MRRSYILFFFLLSYFTQGQVIQTVGSWNPNISSNAIVEAGLNYATDYNVESLRNQTNVSLQRGGGFFGVYIGSWRVDISKVDLNWDSRLRLEVRRTGTGNGTGWWFFAPAISNGTVYQQIQNNATPFFQGNGVFTNIPIQYRISGLSVLIPAGNYSTTVVYTLLEL